MPHPKVTSETDTFDILVKKITALGKINQESLLELFQCQRKKVIVKYEHKLELNLSFSSLANTSAVNQGKINEKILESNKEHFVFDGTPEVSASPNDPDRSDDGDEHSNEESHPTVPNHPPAPQWKLVTTKKIEVAEKRYKDWRYRGKRLHHLFLNQTNSVRGNLQMKKYEDVIECNKELIKLSERYAKMLDDNAESRHVLRTLLTNLEIVQVAIGQLQTLTFDVENSLTEDGDGKVRPSMEKIIEGMNELSEILPDATLCLEASHVDEDDPLEDVENIPIFENCKAIECRETLSQSPGSILALESFSYDTKQYVASASEDGTIHIYDVLDNSFVTSLTGHFGCVTSLCVFEQGRNKYLVSGGVDKAVKLWNLGDNLKNFAPKCVSTLDKHPQCIRALTSYKYQKNTFLVTGTNDEIIRIWNCDDLCQTLVKQLHSHTLAISALKVYPQEEIPFLISASHDRKIKIWNLDNDELVATLYNNICITPIWSISLFEHENRMVLASGSEDQTIRLWDLEDYKCIGSLKGFCCGVEAMSAIEHKGDVCLVSSSYNNNVRIINLRTRRTVKKLTAFTKVCSLKAFENEFGQGIIVSGDKRGKVQIWMEPEKEPEPEPEPVVEIESTPVNDTETEQKPEHKPETDLQSGPNERIETAQIANNEESGEKESTTSIGEIPSETTSQNISNSTDVGQEKKDDEIGEKA